MLLINLISLDLRLKTNGMSSSYIYVQAAKVNNKVECFQCFLTIDLHSFKGVEILQAPKIQE